MITIEKLLSILFFLFFLVPFGRIDVDVNSVETNATYCEAMGKREEGRERKMEKCFTWMSHRENPISVFIRFISFSWNSSEEMEDFHYVSSPRNLSFLFKSMRTKRLSNINEINNKVNAENLSRIE